MRPRDEDIHAFIEAVTYKPGWNFYIRREPRGWLLMARVNAEDAFNPGRKTQIVQTRPIEDWLFDMHGGWMQQLAHEVHALIAELEGHERLEWLKLDGRWFWHPHPNGESRSGPYGPAFTEPKPPESVCAPVYSATTGELLGHA